MYVREKIIKFLKIKNVISSVIGIFEIAVSTEVMVSLISYYWGDWETVITAKATPDSVLGFIIGIILLIWAFSSKNMIGDAYFYSSYFEGDLDGNIEYSDLTAITGKSIYLIKIQLHLFRLIYMKNYKFKIVNKSEQIELYSKKYTCECRKCGAIIEKSVYFTGVCPFCKSSDLFAKILTGDRFYSITNQMPGDRKKPEFYSSKHLKLKKALFVCGLCFGLMIFFTALFACIGQIVNYNDQEYLTDVLLSGKSYSTYALIKSEILDGIIWAFVLLLAMVPLIYAMGIRLKDIFTTNSCSKYLSKLKRPFAKATSLPVVKNSKHGIKSVKRAICRHYLINCSFEKHGDVLKIALARKIIKDECPSCGATIVGAVNENYKCKYCGNMIMDVIRKK